MHGEGANAGLGGDPRDANGVAVIGIPAGDQFVKAIIFDVPALVSETYDLVREQLSGGSGGHP